MTEPRVVELIGKLIAINDTMRANVVAELPEIEWISDPTLRQNVTDAWAAALAASPFSRISEMKPSGNYDTRPLRHGTQADHFRSVTRMAIKIAEDMAALFPDFRYDRDILIGGCLCHDIGKVWEFDPENVRRWNADPRANGRPSIRHPAFGLYIGLAMGLPEGIAHCAAAHSGEGELVVRSLENTILHQTDRTQALEDLAVELLARGLSVRDIEDAFRDETGRLLLSRTAVSELGERLWADYQEFATRDLSEYDIAYLFVDSIAERIRPGQRREPVMAAWGHTATGARVLLHLMAGSKEDAETVTAFFQDMRGRGLGDPLLVVSDGAPGVIKAIETCFPRSARQRCLAPRIRNLATKVPDDQ